MFANKKVLFRLVINPLPALVIGLLAFATPARAETAESPVAGLGFMLAWLVTLITLAGLWRGQQKLKAESRARQQAINAWRQSEARLVEAQRVAQEAQRGQQEALRLAFEHAHTAMFLIAPDGQILQSNAKASEMLGYHRSELERMTVADISVPEDAASGPAGIDRLIGGDGAPALLEQRYRHRQQGRIVHGLLSSVLLRDARGQPQYVIAQVQDLSERQQLEKALHASEEKLRHLAEGASDIIYTLDLDGRFQYISPNWKDMLGRAPDGLLGQRHAWLIHPDDRPACQAFLDRILCGRGKLGGIEYRIRHADGAWRWHSANAAPLLDTANRLVGLLGVAHDISERKQADARLFRLAHFDALTDLPQRHLFNDRLQQALLQTERHGGRIALLLIDLDHFKPVNDRWGHAVGDLVLQEVARRISGCARVSDSVGRLGGDTFVVLLVDAGTEQEVVEMAERIRHTLAEPFLLREQTHALSCCIGAALYPQHGLDEIELARHADLALDLAKASGRNNTQLFSQVLLATGAGPVATSLAATSPA